jgi:hypothetical protein
MKVVFKLLRNAAILLITLVVIFLSAYIVSVGDRLFPSPQTVVIYAKNDSPAMFQLAGMLEFENIPYLYANVDGPMVQWEMRWKFGEDYQRLATPLAQVRGQVFPAADVALIAMERDLALRENSAVTLWPLERMLAAAVLALLLPAMLVLAVIVRRRKRQRN